MRNKLRNSVAAVVATALAATAILAIAANPAAATTPVTTTIGQAAHYGANHNLRTSIAVLDLHTGQYYGAGDPGYFGTASVVKAIIATKILATGQMNGSTATEAWSMITRSDDNAGTDLWNRFGGPNIINWVKAYYRIPFLGYPNTRPNYWGNTHITARGLVYFYLHVKNDRRVGPWLINAMHRYSCAAADGTNQCFGIPSAATHPAIKQGWAAHSADNPNDAVVNTTGLTDNDRYAIAILTEGRNNNNSDDNNGYNTTQGRVVTTIAHMLMPGGQIDDNLAAHNPHLNLDAATANTNGTVNLRGWAFDPDTSGQIRIEIHEAGRGEIASTTTNQPRPDVNRTYHLTGNHGFTLNLTDTPGRHTYLVLADNVDYGTTNTHTLITITIPTKPATTAALRTAHTITHPTPTLHTTKTSPRTSAAIQHHITVGRPHNPAIGRQKPATHNPVERATHTSSRPGRTKRSHPNPSRPHQLTTRRFPIDTVTHKHARCHAPNEQQRKEFTKTSAAAAPPLIRVPVILSGQHSRPAHNSSVL